MVSIYCHDDKVQTLIQISKIVLEKTESLTLLHRYNIILLYIFDLPTDSLDMYVIHEFYFIPYLV